MATRNSQTGKKQTPSSSDMKNLKELKAVTKELEGRAKTSGALFKKKFNLMKKLGIEAKGLDFD